MDKLLQSLGIEQPDLDKSLGFKDQLNDILGLDKPATLNRDLFRPQIQEEKKPSMLDWLKGVKDKMINKKSQ